MEVRLEIRDQRVFLEHGKALGPSDRVGRDVEEAALPQAGKAHEIAPLLRLLPFRVEPDPDFGPGGDFFADRVDVLIP